LIHETRNKINRREKMKKEYIKAVLELVLAVFSLVFCISFTVAVYICAPEARLATIILCILAVSPIILEFIPAAIEDVIFQKNLYLS